jgi:hypothetical protein
MGQKKLLFVETPRMWGVKNIEMAKGLLVYVRYVLDEDPPPSMITALRTAPQGLVFPETATDDDPNPQITSYYIHDLVNVL